MCCETRLTILFSVLLVVNLRLRAGQGQLFILSENRSGKQSHCPVDELRPDVHVHSVGMATDARENT